MGGEKQALAMLITAAATIAAACVVVGALAISALFTWRTRGWWRALFALPIAALGAWAIATTISIAVDPTSHNLWPMELFLWGTLSLPYAGLLCAVRHIVARKSKKEPGSAHN